MNCQRCGVLCAVGKPKEQGDVWPLLTMPPAQQSNGLCSTCAAHWWLYSVDGLRWAFREGGPYVLTLGAVQTALARVMARMHPEFAMLDWARLLAQWELPWPDDWQLLQEVQ